MDCVVCGTLQASLLEWVAFPFSRASSQTRDWTHVSHIAGGFYQLSHKGGPRILECIAHSFSRISSWPRNRTALQADSLPTDLSGKPLKIQINHWDLVVGEAEIGKRVSHTSLQTTVETRTSCWKYFTLFSCDVIGFDFLSSKGGHIGGKKWPKFSIPSRCFQFGRREASFA